MAYNPDTLLSVEDLLNSSEIALNDGQTYTGTFVKNEYTSMLITLATDVDCTYWIDISTDGVNADVQIPYAYLAGQINYPHRITTGPRYFRVRVVNASGSNMTFMRLGTYHGDFTSLEIGLDRIVTQSNDATVVRPTDFRAEVGLGLRQGVFAVNQWGSNGDVDAAATELLASFGPTAFDPKNDIISTAQTLDITYTNTLDGSTATGARQLAIEYLDVDFKLQTAFHTLGSTGSDTTAFTCLGINRTYCVASGGDSANGGDITFTATTDLTVQAQIPAGASVSQQLIYHIPISNTLFMDELDLNALKLAGGGSPRVTFELRSYSRVTSMSYLTHTTEIDTASENHVKENFPQPLKFTGREVIYVDVTTDTNNTAVSGGFSGILHKD